jgi:plasmid maintenance system antidote protein VapI
MGLTEFSNLIHGTKDVNPEIAKMINKVLGTSAEFWLNLQKQWDEREKR